MVTAYIDCIAGVSGDMLMGALIDAGVPTEKLRKSLMNLELPGFSLAVDEVQKVGISARQVNVNVTDHTTERHVAEIISLVEDSSIPTKVKRRAIRVFRRLGEVEGKIHGSSLEQVHLHELGGIDTIVDVVGVLMGFELLKIEKIVCSPLPLARGFINSAHGKLPLPAPATIALLKGVPVTGMEITGELVTPTGAALIRELVDEFGEVPSMELRRIGYGAGKAERTIPNVIRLLVGDETTHRDESITSERLVLLETNIDDMNPELYDYVSQKLYSAGALDVFTQPVAMKKNRPGTIVSVLCRPVHKSKLNQLLFRETTTIGVREILVQRHSLSREIRSVKTSYGLVKVKVVYGEGIDRRWAPEYDDCRRIAMSKDVPLQVVYQEALAADCLLD